VGDFFGVFGLVYRKQKKVIEKACECWSEGELRSHSGRERAITGSILAVIKELHVEREAVIHGMTYLLHSLFVGVPPLQEATVAPNDLLFWIQPELPSGFCHL